MVKPGKAVALVTMDGKNVYFFLSLNPQIHATLLSTLALFNLPFMFLLFSLMFLVFSLLLFPTGRYELNCMPYVTCKSCKATWTPGVDDILKDNYWPATLKFSKIFDVDVFFSFEEMKMATPRFSCQAFLKLLHHFTLVEWVLFFYDTVHCFVILLKFNALVFCAHY